MSEGHSEYYFDYNDRYGIKNNRAWIPTAIILSLIFGAWLLWSANHHARPALSYELIAFDNKDPRNIEIRYSITRRDLSRDAICVLVARNYDKDIVGQVEERFTAQDPAQQVRTVRIPSRDDAVNASVTTCYLK